jgi:MFS transporter, DHA2 family, methylenomycin A resistance protein
VTTDELPVTRRAVVLAVMCVGMFLVQLDVTVVNVALPAVRDGLGTDLAGQQWVVDGYAVVLASLLLLGGSTGDRFGHRRIVLAGLVLFGVASLMCALAPGIGALVAGRAVQGLGAALLLPGTLAVIARSYPERAEQARAVGVWAGVSALALPAGPLLGGVLVSAFGWQAVFWVNLPVIAVALPVTLATVSRDAGSTGRRLDVAGGLLAAVALGSTVFAVIDHGQEPGWWAAGVAVLALVGFCLRERHASDPMLPLGLLRVPAFVGANLVAAAMNLVGIGTIFVATLFLQSVQHRDPLLAGTLLLPLFAPLALLAPLSGRLTARVGPRGPMCAGLLLGAAGSAAMIGLTPTSDYPRFLPVLLGLGLGMGLLTAAVVAAAVRAVPADRGGLAGGVNNTARQAAGAVAIAGYGAVAGSPANPGDFTAGLGHLGLFGAVLWLAAIALTWTTVRPGR